MLASFLAAKSRTSMFTNVMIGLYYNINKYSRHITVLNGIGHENNI